MEVEGGGQLDAQVLASKRAVQWSVEHHLGRFLGVKLHGAVMDSIVLIPDAQHEDAIEALNSVAEKTREKHDKTFKPGPWRTRPHYDSLRFRPNSTVICRSNLTVESFLAGSDHVSFKVWVSLPHWDCSLLALASFPGTTIFSVMLGALAFGRIVNSIENLARMQSPTAHCPTFGWSSS